MPSDTFVQTVTCPLCNTSHQVDMESTQCNLCGAHDQEFLFNRTDLAIACQASLASCAANVAG